MRCFQGKIFGIISKDFAKILYEGLIVENIILYQEKERENMKYLKIYNYSLEEFRKLLLLL